MTPTPKNCLKKVSRKKCARSFWMFAYGDYKRQLAKRERDYAVLDRKREVLKNRVALLNPDHANPDMVDEMVRKELNVAHPDEVIVPLGN